MDTEEKRTRQFISAVEEKHSDSYQTHSHHGTDQNTRQLEQTTVTEM